MLTQDELKSLLFYDARTGEFIWRVSRGSVGNDRLAGCIDTSNGHLKISVEGKKYYASRLAHLYMTGRWPPDQMDHRNGDPLDNRWSNLRPATPSQNLYNKRVTGRLLKGVKRVGSRFRARVHVNSKEIHLGYFATEAEAHAAYVDAASKFYGEFFNAGRHAARAGLLG